MHTRHIGIVYIMYKYHYAYCAQYTKRDPKHGDMLTRHCDESRPLQTITMTMITMIINNNSNNRYPPRNSALRSHEFSSWWLTREPIVTVAVDGCHDYGRSDFYSKLLLFRKTWYKSYGLYDRAYYWTSRRLYLYDSNSNNNNIAIAVPTMC